MTSFAPHLKIDTSAHFLPGPSSDARMQVSTTYSANSLRVNNINRLRSLSNASTSSSISFVSPTASSSANGSAVSLVPQSAGSTNKSPIPSPSSATFDDSIGAMPEYVLAMHDYEPQHNSSTCLSFRAGQVIHVLNRDPSGWWDGELEGRRGWFPSNYVNTDLNPVEEVEETPGKERIRKRLHNYSKSLSSSSSANYAGIHSRRPSATSDMESHVPAVMIPLSHGLSLLQNAVYSNRITHFQPSTACIISCVRGVLTATDTLLRDAPLLREYPMLADERRLILSTLASLVAQAKRASEESLDEDTLELEADAMLRLGQQVFALVRRFLAIAVQCGVELPERRDVSASMPISTTGSTIVGDSSFSNDDTVTIPSQIAASRTPTKSRVRGRPGTPGANRARSTGDLRSLAKSQMDSTAEVPVPPLPKPTVTELRERLMKKHKPEVSVSSTASSSSFSSLESSEVPARPPFPEGPCTMGQVMDALRSTHDHYLSAVAAFVGHAHSHSRSSHASSTGHMYDLVREIVEMSCKLLAIVESVLQHPDVPNSKLGALRSAKEALYNTTSELAEAVRMISVPLPPTMTDEQEKQLLLRCATAALKAGGDLAVAVKVCLNRSLGERPFIINVPAIDPGSDSYHASGLAKSASMSALNERFDDDMEGDMTIHEIGVDEEPTQTIKPIPVNIMNEASSGSESSDSISKASSRSGETDVTSPDDTKSTKSHKSFSPLIVTRRPVEPDLASPSSIMQTEEDGTTWEGSTRSFPLSALEEKMLNGDLPAPPVPLQPVPELTADPAGYMFSHDYAADDVAYNTESVLVGATLPVLVEKLTPHDVIVDAAFSAVFFMTFRMFCTPLELAETFIARYHLQPPPGLSEEDAAAWMQRKCIPVRLRVSNSIKLWLEGYWRSNPDNTALSLLKDLTTEIAMTFAKPAERIDELICARFENKDMGLSPKGDRTRDPGMSLNPPTASLTSEIPRPTMTKTLLAALRSKNYKTILITDFEPLELARQLTIMESNLYCAITPEEILESGQEGATQKPVNVKAVSSLSTVITGWVTECILDETDVKKRTALAKFFVKVSDKCVSLHNYSTFRSILAALDSSHISRLSNTWTALPQKSKLQLEAMRRLADHSRNYREYRSKLRNTAPPAVPFLGLYLTDITFCREGNPSHRASPLNANKKLLNFNKYHKLARIVQDMQRFQVPYNLKAIPEVQDYLQFVFQKPRKGDLQDLYRRSIMLEPKQPADAPLSGAPTDIRQLLPWTSRSQTVGVV
ncbi:Ras guanine nucleotide exchange factor bud5 [Stygiomarasmius scandens]|uniref:Ras guanine nucleotide exchange factor bud5 n=1 Tax=Marasmiellus scandens TaxID=2682957 RepID=A0ABR1K474_9AGAR